MQRRSWIVSVSSGLLTAGVLAWGCAPAVESGECSAGAPCPRGSECNLDEAICEDLDHPTAATETPSEANFTNKDIPFFRGRVCTVTESQAGASFPVWVNPCLHPCLDVSRFEFKHSWTCTGSTCEAYAAVWMNVDGAACPEDAFGEFAASECNYSTPINFEIAPVYGDGSPVQGSMTFEMPFLSNEDAAAIAAASGSQGVIEERLQQYPQDPARIVGGGPISILDSSAAPPENCGEDGSACDCFEIGF